MIRSISTKIQLTESYVSRVPLPDTIPRWLKKLEANCIQLKQSLVSQVPTERTFMVSSPLHRFDALVGHAAATQDDYIGGRLHTLEGISEFEVFRAYGIDPQDTETVIQETGKPVGWYPMIYGYDRLPDLEEHVEEIPTEVFEKFRLHNQQFSRLDEMMELRSRLRALYEAGPGVRVDGEQLGGTPDSDEDEEELSIGAYMPMPPETFIEELSQKLEIHPISVYWLLKEMREKEGLRCPSEEKRRAEDYLSVMIIRMFGYQWPKQVEAGEPLPEWVDEDGIIPLTDGLGEATLLDRVRERFGADFGEEKEASIEAEFGNIVGKSLARWLEEDFFERHVKQFKNRPIAWHIVSDPSVADSVSGPSAKGKKKTAKKKRSPAFSVMVYYHRFVDGEKGYRMLQLLRNKYLEKMISQTRTELEGLRGKGDDPEVFDRIAELDRRMMELEHFKEKLERIQEGKDREAWIHVRWKGPEEQPKGWRPDINDGVKINIAPWERLGMFPVKKIVGNVEMGKE